MGVAASIAFLVPGGCANPHSTGADARPAPRAAELDLLDAWVGEWEGTAEMVAPGQRPVTARTHESVAWECDKRFLVERESWDTGDGQAARTSMAVRSWDPHAKVFRSWYFDSDGMVGHSKMTYAAAARVWHVQTKGADAVTCEPVVGEMTIRQPDARTMEWTFTQWNELRTQKKVEMKGRSMRK